MAYGLLFVLYKLFGLAVFLGLIFFVVWAVKNLKAKQLKNLFIWLLLVGIVGMALLSFGKGSWGDGKFGYGMYGMHSWGMNSGYFNCMQDDDCGRDIEALMDRMMDR